MQKYNFEIITSYAKANDDSHIKYYILSVLHDADISILVEK